MAARFRTACLTSAVLLVTWASGGVAATPPHPLVQHVYSVADIILLPGDAVDAVGAREATAVSCSGTAAHQPVACTHGDAGAGDPKASEQIAAKRLMRLIDETVQPQSWKRRGGHGVMKYCAAGKALVIQQTPEVQEQVADLLAAVRRLQDIQVAVEVRIITLSDDALKTVTQDLFISKAGQKPPLIAQPFQLPAQRDCTPVAGPPSAFNSVPERHLQALSGLVFLNDIQLFQLLEVIQGDRHSNIMQAPKITTFNGQSAAFGVTDEQFFVTGVDTVRTADQTVRAPRNEQFATGLRMSVQPTVSADRRFVRLKLNANWTTLQSSKVALFPVTTFITPEFEGGAKGKPVPFTQFLQQPQFNKLTLDRVLNIPDGGTALLSGWKRVTFHHDDVTPPVLGQLPYLQDLFKNVLIRREVENVLVMVTPQIIVAEEEEVRQASFTCPSVEPTKAKEVSVLLERYHRACAEGRTAEATRFAVQALALEPACFDKGNAAKEEKLRPCVEEP